MTRRALALILLFPLALCADVFSDLPIKIPARQITGSLVDLSHLVTRLPSYHVPRLPEDKAPKYWVNPPEDERIYEPSKEPGKKNRKIRQPPPLPSVILTGRSPASEVADFKSHFVWSKLFDTPISEQARMPEGPLNDLILSGLMFRALHIDETHQVTTQMIALGLEPARGLVSETFKNNKKWRPIRAGYLDALDYKNERNLLTWGQWAEKLGNPVEKTGIHEAKNWSDWLRELTIWELSRSDLARPERPTLYGFLDHPDIAMPVLVELLEHPHRLVRWNSLEGLCSLEPPQLGDILVKLLDHEDPVIQARAWARLGVSPSARPWCLRQLKQDDQRLQWMALETLAWTAVPEDIPVLRQFLEQLPKTDVERRRTIYKALMLQADPPRDILKAEAKAVADDAPGKFLVELADRVGDAKRLEKHARSTCITYLARKKQNDCGLVLRGEDFPLMFELLTRAWAGEKKGTDRLDFMLRKVLKTQSGTMSRIRLAHWDLRLQLFEAARRNMGPLPWSRLSTWEKQFVKDVQRENLGDPFMMTGYATLAQVYDEIIRHHPDSGEKVLEKALTRFDVSIVRAPDHNPKANLRWYAENWRICELIRRHFNAAPPPKTAMDDMLKAQYKPGWFHSRWMTAQAVLGADSARLILETMGRFTYKTWWPQMARLFALTEPKAQERTDIVKLFRHDDFRMRATLSRALSRVTGREFFANPQSGHKAFTGFWSEALRDWAKKKR